MQEKRQDTQIMKTTGICRNPLGVAFGGISSVFQIKKKKISWPLLLMLGFKLKQWD